MRTDMQTRQFVVALARDEDKLKAVKLTKQAEALELLWTKSSKEGNGDWAIFADECGLAIEPLSRASADGNKMSVVGFDSAGVGFYRIGVPAAGEDEISAMVRLQAEALLPLSTEQMELAWRTGQTRNGQVAVTIAAARKEHLQRFIDNVKIFQPTKILLNLEAIVKVWRKLFDGNDEKAVVVNLTPSNTQVCLSEEGRLSNAAALDMGIEDLLTSEGLTEQTEATERFVQDMRSVLVSFGYAEPMEAPVFVLSDGKSEINKIISCLKSAGLKVEAALPDTKEPKIKTEADAQEIYEYRVPIGIGLCALDSNLKKFDIFKSLYKPARIEKKKHWLYSPRVAGVITAVMLVVLIMVSYAVDVASPKAIEQQFQTSNSSADIKLLMERQKLMKIVAQQRPDLLDLINQVTASGEKGILLDSLYFKKGQPVNISGQVENSDQLYKFQENLLQQKNIKEVRIQNASKNDKGGTIKFAITFHYKNFTGK